MECVVDDLAARYAKKNQTPLFEALKPFIMSSSSLEPQASLAARLGMGDSAFRIAVHRLRQRYAEGLRKVVKSTLVADENVEEEIAHLISAFS
jgi:RNA polymerase sigma-70 factor (ECF subfamily)